MDEAGDCFKALQELYVYLDGELTPERRRIIQVHLDQCPPCYQAYDFEAELRLVISQKCREQVPETLRTRVQHVLASEGGWGLGHPDHGDRPPSITL